ncbi:MAG: pyridoxine 5'-phosphate synthase [Candidatus Omnitrophota bacterium]
MPKLGVNIDHVATLRQARGGIEPEPIKAATICEKVGVDSIVLHLREDRRHIQDKDLITLRKTVKTRLNLEMSVNREIVDIACSVVPDQVTLVPEKRQELTTEGGLDVVGNSENIKSAIDSLKKKNIDVSLFIDPEEKQIKSSKEIGCDFIELHTGRYADSRTDLERDKHLKEIIDSTEYALKIGLGVNAGHGLNYQNVGDVARIPGIEELNIGHSIISYAVFVGLEEAVKQMLRLVRN